MIPAEHIPHLMPLGAPSNRAINWFEIPEKRLYSTCSVAGCEYVPYDEASYLSAIANALAVQFTGFERIVSEVAAASGHKSSCSPSISWLFADEIPAPDRADH